MKKAITITFGLIGLIFGLVFSSTKIEAINLGNNNNYYWANTNGSTLSIIAPDLESSEIGTYEFDSFTREYYNQTTNQYRFAIISFDTIKVEYNDVTNNKQYNGIIDSIFIEINQPNVDIKLFYQDNIAFHYTIDRFDTIQGTMVIKERLLDNGYDTGYDNGYSSGYQAGISFGHDNAYQDGYNNGYQVGNTAGYDNGYDNGYQEGNTAGYDNGYQEGVSTVYENGFGGIINPDTNNYYKDSDSYPYGKGFTAGFESTESGGLWTVLFSALLAPFEVLGMELLPGVTIGMIVAVPLVFGLLAWILSVGKAKK